MLRFMHLNKKLFSILLVTSLSNLSGCGTLVGNPKKPGEGDDSQKNEIALPDFEYQLPNALIEEGDGYDDAALHGGFSLAASGRYTILHSSAFRMYQTVAVTQKIIRRLANEDGVNTDGKHFKKGENQNIDLVIGESSEQSEYEYESVFCNSGEIFLQLEWNDNKIRVIRSLARNPLNENESTAYLAEFTISKSELGTGIEYIADGRYRKPLVTKVDGKLIREYVRYNRYLNNQITIESVHDWYNDDDVLEGDIYTLAQMSAVENTGSFISYDKGLSPRCDGIVVEENPLPEFSPLFFTPVASSFCLGRVIGSDESFTPAQRLREYAKLKSLEVPSYQNIRSIGFDSSLSCPVE